MNQTLRDALDHFAAGAQTEADLAVLRRALETRQIVLATGERAVTAGGSITDTVIVTGDGNVVTVLHGAGGEAFKTIFREVLTGKLLASPEPGEPPYKGLDFYDVKDARLFFGREKLTAKLVAAIREHTFLAIVGDSGSGKSSLARAGVIATLQGHAPRPLPDNVQPPLRSSNWRYITITPTTYPLESLARGILGDGNAATALQKALKDTPASLREQAQALAGEEGHVLLLVDQFEEIFTLCRNEPERASFVEALLEASRKDNAATPCTVIITLRADFYPQCLKYAALHEVLPSGQFNVGAMDHYELKRTIELPAEEDGHWAFEPGLVQQILADVGAEAGNLPLLSYAMLETWRQRNGRVMTLDGYDKVGRVQKAISQTADRVYVDLEQQGLSNETRSIFLNLVALPSADGQKASRRRELLQTLAPDYPDSPSGKALKTLSAPDARLITINQHKEVQLVHDALITAWPRLQEWLQSYQEELRRADRLRTDADAWGKAPEKQRAEFLIHRDRLKDAQNLTAANIISFSESVRMYLSACHEAETTRQRNRLRLMAVAFIVVSFLSLLAAWFGVQSNRNANLAATREADAQAEQFRADAANKEKATSEAKAKVANEGERQASEKEARERQAADLERRRSRASELAAMAQTVFTNEPGNTSLALLLALEAAKTTWPQDRYIPTDVASTIVDLTSAGLSPLNTFPPHYHRDKINSLEFSADGQLLVSASDDQTARVWDLTTREQVVDLIGHTDRVTYAEFSPDGSLVATSSADGSVRIWSSSSGLQLQQLTGHHGVVTSLAFSLDGHTLYSAGEDSRIITWDATSWKLTAVHELGRYSYALKVLTPDELLVGDTEIWDLTSWKLLRRYSINGDVRGQCQIAADQSNRLIGLKGLEFRQETMGSQTSGYSVDSILVLDDSTGEQILNHTVERTEHIKCLSIDPEGNHIAFSTDKGVSIRDIKSGNEELTLEGLNVAIVAFSPDGKYIATTDSRHNSIQVHNALDGSLISELGSHRFIQLLQYSPDGSRAATLSYPNLFRVWDIAEKRELMQASGSILPNAFDPMGNRIIGKTPHGSTQVWDANTGQVILRLEEPSLNTHLFSHDGRFLFASNQSGAIMAWDLVKGTESRPISQQVGGINVMVWGTDESKLITGGDDGAIYVWDVDEEIQLMVFDEHRSKIRFMILGSDNHTVTSADADGVVYVWSVDSGRVLNTWTSQGNEIVTLQPRMKGAIFLELSSRGEATVWSIDEESATPTFRRTFSETHDLKMHLTERYLAVVEPGNVIKTWDIHSGEEVGSISTGAAIYVGAISISPDQCCLMAGVDGTARTWSLQSEFGDRPKVLNEGEDTITAATFSPDGKQIVAGTDNGFAIAWNRMTGREIFRLSHGTHLFDIDLDFVKDLDANIVSNDLKQLIEEHGYAADWVYGERVVEIGQQWTFSNATSGTIGDKYLVQKRDQALGVYKQARIESLAFSPNGNLLATLDEDANLSMWDVNSRKRLYSVDLGKNDHGFSIRGYAVVFSFDGLKVAVGIDHTPCVRILDVRDGAYLMGFSNSSLIAFDPQGSKVAITNMGSARIGDANNGAVISWFEGHTKDITSIQFSPTGDHVLTASGDGTIRLWDRFGHEIRQFPAHTNGVDSARFDSSGNYIVSTGSDMTVRVWDTSSSQEILRFDDFKNHASYAEFSTDGRWLLVLTGGMVDLRPATPDGLINIAESLIQRDPPILTAAERDRYGLD